MNRNVAIVHYNTPELTRAAILSLRKHTKGCKVTVFDNSDKRPFQPMPGVTVIDNTKGQVIDFDAMLDRYPNKVDTVNEQGSAKHIASVDYLFDVLSDGFVLMDSDVLVKCDIAPFFDGNAAWAGKIEHEPPFRFMQQRLFPFLLWINVPMLRKFGIRFWHEGMVYKLSHTGAPYYDTAGSLLKDCTDHYLPSKQIDIDDFIEHFGGGSCGRKTVGSALAWLYGENLALWKEDIYLVVIPYLASAAQGREIEYAIAGWRKHFKENYLIVLVGEGLPQLDAQDVYCLESPRVAAIEGQWRQHLDYVSCFKKVHEEFPDTDGFIMVADDCFALNDFDISDVKLLKMLEPDFSFREDSPNGWRRDKMKTKKVLQAASLPTRNFTTHLPQWYDWDKIEALWEKYDMLHSSQVIEDLYYNTYYADRIPFQLQQDTDNLKCGVYDKSAATKERIAKAPSRKIWITNSPDGWCKELTDVLKKHYNM